MLSEPAKNKRKPRGKGKGKRKSAKQPAAAEEEEPEDEPGTYVDCGSVLSVMAECVVVW